MQAFLTELVRFLAVLADNGRRWAMRNRRNVFLVAGVACAALIAFSTIAQAGAPKETVKPQKTEAVDPMAEYTAISAEPVAGEQAAPRAGAAKDEGAPGVAKAWATAYLQRPSAEDSTWQTKIAPYTMGNVLQQLSGPALKAEGLLYDLGGSTTVKKVEIFDPAPDAEKNTPVRWSHTVTATVAGEKDPKKPAKITFSLVLMDSDEGWMVTSVETQDITR